jgi:hypothetical protein
MMAAASTQRIGTSSFFGQKGKLTAHSDIGTRNSSAQDFGSRIIRKVCRFSGSCSGVYDLSMIPPEKSVTFRDQARQKGAGNKNLLRREPAGVLGQQTFIDLTEDRDCALGVFIVIRGDMSGMQIPRGAGAARGNLWGLSVTDLNPCDAMHTWLGLRPPLNGRDCSECSP